MPGKQFQQTGNGFREPFDNADSTGRGAKTRREEDRKQRIDYFTRGVVEETDETDSDNVGWEFPVTSPESRNAFTLARLDLKTFDSGPSPLS
jgi:hypothetical protein